MRRVVITGLGLMTSIGSSVDETWNNLLSTKSGIQKITSFDVENLSCKIAGFISDDVNYMTGEVISVSGGDWI